MPRVRGPFVFHDQGREGGGPQGLTAERVRSADAAWINLDADKIVITKHTLNPQILNLSNLSNLSSSRWRLQTVSSTSSTLSASKISSGLSGLLAAQQRS